VTILRKHNRLVNEAIKSLGINPKVCKDDTPNVWRLHRDEAQIIIILQESKVFKDRTVPTVTMMSPISQVTKDPNERLKLFDYILQLNHKLTTETFSLSNDWLILSSTYYIDEMEPKEIAQMLDSLSFHAAQFLAQVQEDKGA